MNGVTGIVLCGGHSRRMGRPKAWLPFGEEFLLQRVVRIVGEAVGKVIVVAAKDQTLPPLPDYATRLEDHVSGSGPLAGLAAGLTAVDPSCEAVFLTACDSPFLTVEFVRQLIRYLLSPFQPNQVLLGWQPMPQIVVPTTGILTYQPLSAVYLTSILPIVERRLAEGQLRMQDLILEVPHCTVNAQDFSSIDFESTCNINTPDDYTAALAEYNRRYGTERTP